MSWDRIKTVPNPQPRLELGGIAWRVVDEIVMVDAASERAHAVTIDGAKDTYPQRNTQRYPDGTAVMDTGHGILEGTIAFRVGGLTAARPLVLLVRTDVIVGNCTLAVTAGGRPAGEVAIDVADRATRWRNWPIPIAAEHVTGTTLDVRLHAKTPGRDFHCFHVWVYQS